MRQLRKLFLLFSVTIMLLGFTACRTEGPLEEAGENLDEAVEDVGDAIEDATD